MVNTSWAASGTGSGSAATPDLIIVGFLLFGGLRWEEENRRGNCLVERSEDGLARDMHRENRLQSISNTYSKKTEVE